MPFKIEIQMIKPKLQNKLQFLMSNVKIEYFAIPALSLFFHLCFGFWHYLYAAEPPRYEIDATIDTAHRTITAKERVSFTNTSDKAINELYFHIYPHRRYTQKEIGFIYRYAGYFKVNPFPEGFQAGDLRIESVASSGQALTYIIEGNDQTILKINLNASLEPLGSREIEIDFKLLIPHAYGKFGWHKELMTLVRWYPILSVLDKDGWHNYPFYIYHQPYFSDASYYKVSVTLPAKEKAVSSGSLKEEKLNLDGTKTLVLETEFPVRDFSLGVSSSLLLYVVKDGPLTINSYYLPGREVKAASAAHCALDMIRFNSDRFGEYPYKEFNIVPSYLGYGGVQSSCLVFIDTRVYKLPGFLNRYFDFLISHETSHQWFFNIVGSDEYREMFLDEGMNSYWVLQYLESKYGPGAEVMQLPDYFKWFIPNFSFRDSAIARYIYLTKNGLDSPVIGELSSFKEPSSIFALTYGKGAAVLEMLRAQVGDKTFNKIIKRYMSEFRFKNISLEDFIMICNDETAQDMRWFFNSWLKTKDTCDYAIQAVSKDKIILENHGSIEMPVDTKIFYKDGREAVEHWNGSGKNKTITIEGKEKIKRIEIDAQKSIILDTDRTNNIWPRDITVKPVPLYFFAYEIPVFLSRQSYNLVLGPTCGGSSLGGAASFQKAYDNIFKFSSNYDFSDKQIESMAGYEIRHVGNKQIAFGFEIFDRESGKDEEDVLGGKIYLRKELWPASYGIFDLNDHITAYLVRDQKLGSTTNLSGKEDIRNIHYRKRDEAIVGISGSLGRYGPYSDPDYGWKFIPTQEFAGHFLGGKESFWRSSIELDNYCLVLPRYQHKIATRMKFGWGEASDKNLFQLGGPDGLRGYSRKTIEGAHMLLGGLEYRFPLVSDMKMYFLDNIFSLDKIQAVGFFDVGKSWHADFSGADFKKDAGFGFRFHFDVAGFLEKVVVRVDISQALNEPKEEPRVWFGVSHSF